MRDFYYILINLLCDKTINLNVSLFISVTLFVTGVQSLCAIFSFIAAVKRTTMPAAALVTDAI